MLAALQGTFGINQATLYHSVPATTLKDQPSGRIIHGTSCSAKPYLSKDEEEELVDFLITCCKLGYGKTKQEVLTYS